MKKHVIIFFSLIILCAAIFAVAMFFLVLYPVKYKHLVSQYAKEYGLEKVLIYSVINAESGFNKNAVSKVGAIGLMQLMPATAKEIAEKLNEPFSLEQLSQPETNIKYGCYYLHFLLTTYNFNITNAVAAYNAGPNKVNEWLKNNEFSKNGTLHNIPYAETKKYVKKISNNLKIYSAIT